MRIYVPAAVTDGAPGVRLSPAPQVPSDTVVWGIEQSALAGLRPDDVEELEYAAMQEAVLVAAEAMAGQEDQDHHRVVILAADVPDSASDGTPGDQGDHARVVRADEPIRIRSLHVSENSARGVREDEYAPDLLWFDPSELEGARDYARGEAEPGELSGR